MHWHSSSPHASVLGRSAVCFALAVALGAGPRVARAANATTAEPASNDPKENAKLNRAMRAFELGREAYDTERFSDALDHFHEAASLYGSPDFQFNIGLCHEMLGNYSEAIRAFETYIRVKPDAEDRAEVETRIAELKEAEEKGEAPPRPRVITVRGPTAEELKENAAAVLGNATRERKKEQARTMIIAGGTTLGIGAAVGLGGGIAFGILAKSRSNDLDEIQTGGNPGGATFADASDIESEGTSFEIGQIATIGAGAAIGIAGAVVLAIGLKRRKALQSGTTTVLVPSLGRGHAGVVLQGRF